MKQFVVFVALVAVACAGRLPHNYHHRATAASRVDNSYLAPAPAPAESRVDKSYLSPSIDNSYLGPAESRVESTFLAPAASEIVLVKEKLHENNGLEGYEYSYELSDGQKKEETAQLINSGTEEEAIAVRGSYQWTDDVTGQVYKVNYVADENGFRAEGDHLPKA